MRKEDGTLVFCSAVIKSQQHCFLFNCDQISTACKIGSTGLELGKLLGVKYFAFSHPCGLE